MALALIPIVWFIEITQELSNVWFCFLCSGKNMFWKNVLKKAVLREKCIEKRDVFFCFILGE